MVTNVSALNPDHPWYETDRQIAVSTHYDRAAAREMNAENFLTDAEPFGSLREDAA